MTDRRAATLSELLTAYHRALIAKLHLNEFIGLGRRDDRAGHPRRNARYPSVTGVDVTDATAWARAKLAPEGLMQGPSNLDP